MANLLFAFELIPCGPFPVSRVQDSAVKELGFVVNPTGSANA
jgi:hypothetical protein